MHELGFIDETGINVYQRPDHEGRGRSGVQKGGALRGNRKREGDGISYHYSNRV